MSVNQDKYASKIAKLLAKAESTTAEEAKLLIAKAQELMAEYAIEQAMVDAARGIERDEIEQRKLFFTGNYRWELKDLAWEILRVNNCMAVQWQCHHDDGGRKAVVVRRDWNGNFKAQTTSSKKAVVLEITGFVSDLDRALLLETSLRLQAVSEMTTWWQQEGKEAHDGATYRETVNIRKDFVDGFRAEVSNRLHLAYQNGKTSAIKVEATRAGQTESEAGDSVALVLRNRKDRVQDWYDNRYGKLGNSRARNRGTASYSASNAGRSAGRRADVGQPKVGGNRGALTS